MWRQREERWRRLLEEVRRWARELAEELRRRGIRVEKVILFGSYARGDFAAGSDLDLIVVSDDWGRLSYTERLSLLYRLWGRDVDANFVPLTRRELEEGLRRSVVLRDASRYWMVVYEREG